MTAPSSKTTLVLLLVQWRKVLKRLGCLLNQGENSARGFWILCECGVWRPSEMETRGFFRAHILWQDQFAVCAEDVRAVGSWEEHTGCPAKESSAPCCLASSTQRSHLLHLAGSRCFVQGQDCSVGHALLLWKLVAVGEASVRPASPW